MIRFTDLRAIFFLLLAIQLEQFSLRRRGVLFSEAKMEERFEKCCGLGTSWATEGLGCEKFTGPVSGVPTVEQGLCLEAVDICCVRTYHEVQCKKGKSDARAGLACFTSTKSKRSGPGDYHRDCCEACKLGIIAGSMGEECAFNKFSFGNPWDPVFLECCHEASPSTTTFSTDATSSSETTETESIPSSFSTSLSSETTSDSTSSSRATSDSTSFSPSIPTPPLDDICQLMKGLLCSDICVPTPGSFYCKCREGFTLLEDGKTCRQDLPTDRCKSTNPCEQRCTDNGDTVRCSCNPGYELADDKRSCIPESSETKSSVPNDDYLLLCPVGHRYNATNQVCDDVNECIEHRPCPGRCENTIGSFVCVSKNGFKTVPYEDCPPGYQWEPSTSVCTDIDECVILPDPCPVNKHFCVNTQGSFSCIDTKGNKSCPAGFKFDQLSQQCEDVNECAEQIHSCLEGTEECRNTEGAYECDLKCDKGFTYNIRFGACVDIDECVESNNTCPDTNTTCRNTLGSYECLSLNISLPQFSNEEQESLICAAGYKSSNNSKEGCIDVDECKEELHSCERNERCVNAIGSYSCEPLNNHANLTRNNKDVYAYSYGKRSKTSMSPVVDRTTFCSEGFVFDRRTSNCIDVDECSNGLSNCGIGEQCINFEGGYRCSPLCPPGFQLNDNNYHSIKIEQACQDINECSLGVHSCNISTHYCINTNGSYYCEEYATTTSTSSPPRLQRNYKMQNIDQYFSLEACRHGYTRDLKTGECVDVDECASGPGCRDHEQCLNTPGSFECSPLCITGWYFNTATKGCQDVDECLLGRHDCPQFSHECVNTNGSYLCEVIPPCSHGYKRSFNGTCIDVDECLENLHACRLELHQYCVNRNGSYECITRLPSCQAGYQYSLASRQCEDVDECVTDQYKCDSRLSEKCVNLPGSYRCERPTSSGTQYRQRPACRSGFRYHPRYRKCTDIDECAEGLDSCEGEICYNQPGGYSCSKPVKPITRRPPTTSLPVPPSQKCPSGTRFENNRCVDVNECREIDEICSSNEECVNTVGSYKCDCKIGFRRENLTQACVDINECQTLQDSCAIGQRCDNTIGSYTCTRYLSCGTGYTLNAATEICEDDDECLLGTHDCGGGYHCRNTLGSYRCDRNPRGPVALPRLDVATTTTPPSTTIQPTTTPRALLTSITTEESYNCPTGFERGSAGKCMDINECLYNSNLCGRTLRCFNTIGSYRCVSKVICTSGYTLDPVTGQYCIDADECSDGTHKCAADQTCENRLGGYVCICPSGHVVGPNKDCIDIDECSLYGNICGVHNRCENTIGSYRCICESGFENVGGNAGGSCQDVDECTERPGLCQHTCYNVWGSYRCSCKPGFRLNPDNRSCTDVDECTEFKDNNLCIGICENTPGSYTCKCPDGYKLGYNGRTCEDIDECTVGPGCRSADEICHNTRGSYRCNKINCPSGYRRDHEKKNRCVRSQPCHIHDAACYRQPSHYSYNYITLVSMLPIAPSRPEELFRMTGYHMLGSSIQFSMALLEARAPAGVQRATESCFALKKPMPSNAVLVMTQSIQGPQEIELDLTMEIYHNALFAASAVSKILIFVSQYEF